MVCGYNDTILLDSILLLRKNGKDGTSKEDFEKYAVSNGIIDNKTNWIESHLKSIFMMNCFVIVNVHNNPELFHMVVKHNFKYYDPIDGQYYCFPKKYTFYMCIKYKTVPIFKRLESIINLFKIDLLLQISKKVLG
jgi:hypothetical protein